MARRSIPQVNFAAGEFSPLFLGRIDNPLYYSGAEYLLNWIPLPQGGLRYRTGSKFVNSTRRNNKAYIDKFTFNSEEAYILEFTAGYLRFFTVDGNILTESAVTITGASQTVPCVITATAHGYSDGDEALIQFVEGMTELNGRTFIVRNPTANTFELWDNDNQQIDARAYTAYSSGGTAKKVIEIETPYEEVDLFKLQFAQDGNTMYITAAGEWEQRKLTRTSATTFTLSRYTRTNDPFTDKQTPTGITQANPAVVTITSHGYSDGDEVIAEDIGGMTELNGIKFLVANSTANTFELTDLDGNNINSLGYGAFTSGGYFTKTDEFPLSCTFYEDRLLFGGTVNRQQGLFGSRSTNTTTGESRYDDYTFGTDDDHAFLYFLASREGTPIRSMAGTDSILGVLTFQEEYRVQGSGGPITPTSINARPIGGYGADSQSVINKENIVLFVQRGKKAIRSVEQNLDNDAFFTFDRTEIAEHITQGGIDSIAFQVGVPNLLWGSKGNGEALSLTLRSKDSISGWGRHKSGEGSIEVLTSLPRDTDYDQLWWVAQRTVNGNTRRYVEYIEDHPDIKRLEEFFTDEDSYDDNLENYLRNMYETQKEYVHLDSSLTFDGSVTGTDASASVTPGATTGNSVTFTASANVFESGDVGKEIHKKAVDGVGEGRAIITAFTSATEVTCKIIKDFDNTNAMTAGNWYLTAKVISGLWHLEGETVNICTDGGEHATRTVSNGSITLSQHASVVHVGIQYKGLYKSIDLEGGSIDGPARGRPRNVEHIVIGFQDSLGLKAGMSLDKMEEIEFRSTRDYTDRPVDLFSGAYEIMVPDDWTSESKHVYLLHDSPTPCIIQMISPKMNVGDLQ